MKKCTRCGKTKNITEFGIRTNRSGSPQPNCKKCDAERTREWRKNNPDRVKETKAKYAGKNPGVAAIRSANWRKENPQKYREGWFKSNIKANYGITLEYYNHILSSQGGKCAICGSPSNGNRWRLYIDHCHKTGKVRGLLCYNCNFGIGNLKDDEEIIESALNYIRLHKSLVNELQGVA